MARTGRPKHDGATQLANRAITEMPPVPKGFDKAQALRWFRYCGELIERQLLFETDLEDVGRLCRLESQLDEAISKVEELKPLMNDKAREPRRNPAVMAQNNIFDLISKLKKSLSLGPVYRNKLPGREAGDATKDGQRLAVEAEIRGKYTAKEAKLIIGALDSPMDIWNGDICKKPKLREAARKYLERLEIDEFDI